MARRSRDATARPDGPWAPALRRALSAIPEERYASAGALARALEEMAQRLPGLDERRPYPGLSSFTSADAQFFFGREADVEALLQRLKRPRLLAVVGPSGAGKSSFLRAGVLPCLPREWSAVVATPGLRPFQALAHAMAALVAGDPEAVRQLLRFDNADTVVAIFRSFRERHGHVLVVLDQFEELFTLSDTGVQTAFATLLGRLVIEADCHVLLSLRDDFLLRCSAHEALTPAFSESHASRQPEPERAAARTGAAGAGVRLPVRGRESRRRDGGRRLRRTRSAAAAGVCCSPTLGAA